MPNTKLINCDQLEIALTKVKTYVDGQQAKDVAKISKTIGEIIPKKKKKKD